MSNSTGTKIIYFDAVTNNDYDSIVRYLLENNCPMAKRNKPDLSLAAKVPVGLPKQMRTDVKFEEAITYDSSPLDPNNRVEENHVWD